MADDSADDDLESGPADELTDWELGICEELAAKGIPESPRVTRKLVAEIRRHRAAAAVDPLTTFLRTFAAGHSGHWLRFAVEFVFDVDGELHLKGTPRLEVFPG